MDAMKREADFSIRFRHWLRANPQASAPFEIKQTTTSSISFSVLKNSQINYLRAAASDKGILIRCPGGTGEPDYCYYRNAPSFVVIRYPNAFCIIGIREFLAEKQRSRYDYLSMSRAFDIAQTVVDL